MIWEEPVSSILKVLLFTAAWTSSTPFLPSIPELRTTESLPTSMFISLATTTAVQCTCPGAKHHLSIRVGSIIHKRYPSAISCTFSGCSASVSVTLPDYCPVSMSTKTVHSLSNTLRQCMSEDLQENGAHVPWPGPVQAPQPFYKDSSLNFCPNCSCPECVTVQQCPDCAKVVFVHKELQSLSKI